MSKIDAKTDANGPKVDISQGLANRSKGLTASQRARIESNRQKALLLRQSRIASNYNKTNVIATSYPSNSGGGFLLEENAPTETTTPKVIVHQEASTMPTERPLCEECKKTFDNSFLWEKFECRVCDTCRDKEKHQLITKTDAIKIFLLKDCDLESRDPPLKYMLKKNPHSIRGDMKLFLRSQVEDRALEVWESEDALEEEHERREEERSKRKQRAYDKKVKALRMEVRSSLFRPDRQMHEHVYNDKDEVYDRVNDVYVKKCATCDHTYSYEKM